MFLRSSDERWRNSHGTPPPFLDALLVPRCHQIFQRISNGRWNSAVLLRPMERFGKSSSESNQNKTRPKLRHAKPRSVKHPPIRFIAQVTELLKKLSPVLIETRARESRDI